MMAINDALADCESESGATFAFAGMEGFKDVIKVILRDASTVVGHFYDQCIFSLLEERVDLKEAIAGITMTLPDGIDGIVAEVEEKAMNALVIDFSK